MFPPQCHTLAPGPPVEGVTVYCEFADATGVVRAMAVAYSIREHTARCGIVAGEECDCGSEWVEYEPVFSRDNA